MHRGETGDNGDGKVARFLRLRVVMRKQITSLEANVPLLSRILGAAGVGNQSSDTPKGAGESLASAHLWWVPSHSVGSSEGLEQGFS